MKKEIFTEKNADKSKLKLFICSTIVVILAFFICSIIIFASEADEYTRDVLNPYNLPDVNNEIIENISVGNNETFLAHLYVDGKYYTESFNRNDEFTVMDLINKANVVLSSDDSVSCSVDATLSNDMVVKINRVYYEDVVTYKTISYTKETVPVIYSIFAKKVGSQSAGSDGKKEIVTRTKFVNGEAVESSVVSEKIVKKPISEKTYVDASNLLDLGSGAPTEYVSKLENFRFTAYSIGEVGGSTTATGHKTRVGYVAVDPKVIPLHSKLYIVLDNGFVYGYAYAMDTGGAIKGNIIDLFLPSIFDCNRFGRKTGTVYVIRSGR